MLNMLLGAPNPITGSRLGPKPPIYNWVKELTMAHHPNLIEVTFIYFHFYMLSLSSKKIKNAHICRENGQIEKDFYDPNERAKPQRLF